ncbi:hypothetical protein SAMN04488523_11410 [Sulfitobacter brevis]|uniref:Lipoprotein n=1 Tax=Sulfitobacter brevis TaxID=74348 RepID=A0A1I2F0W6_9RHOB|nr:hypothetical protein [Sulfitobacter brevis]SFE98151.1 hypothetical protein SAMN04488523_11410 [Sulfitobacter brevis]
MKHFPLMFVVAAVPLLSACEQYTEKTSPCFGRNGEPVVTRATLSFAAAAIVSDESSKDCTFEALPRPE